MTAGTLIRRAVPEDAVGIARVHVGSWRETYRGILPDALLDGLSEEARVRLWDGLLARGEGDEFVAVSGDGILGFASGGPQRDAGLRGAGFEGEVLAIYLLRAAQGRGIGRALMGAVADAVAARGMRGLALWVLEANAPARGFYERMGGVAVGEKVERRGEAALREVAYGWPDGRGALTKG